MPCWPRVDFWTMIPRNFIFMEPPFSTLFRSLHVLNRTMNQYPVYLLFLYHLFNHRLWMTLGWFPGCHLRFLAFNVLELRGQDRQDFDALAKAKGVVTCLGSCDELGPGVTQQVLMRKSLENHRTNWGCMIFEPTIKHVGGAENSPKQMEGKLIGKSSWNGGFLGFSTLDSWRVYHGIPVKWLFS